MLDYVRTDIHDDVVCHCHIVMYVCMYVRMYVCMYVCMCLCMCCVSVCMHVYVCSRRRST